MVADEATEWASLFSARVDLKMALDCVDWNDAFRAFEAHGVAKQWLACLSKPWEQNMRIGQLGHEVRRPHFVDVDMVFLCRPCVTGYSRQ